MMETLPLQGRVALVTGAGRGIGRVIALTLAANGALLALAARTLTELEAVREEIEAEGGQAACFELDMRSEQDIVAGVKSVVARFGRLDILINNAGIGVFGPLVDTSTQDWDRVMAVNSRGPFLMCREAIPFLQQQERSYIISISSVVGVKGYANQTAYSASKHALMGMTKALARELQPDGVRVHAICPGGVDTEMATQARPDLDRSILIQPQEIADVVLFLVTRPGNAMIDEIDMRRGNSTPWA
jgi:3-oxoacyl-[acyl-carrier protein] reductase